MVSESYKLSSLRDVYEQVPADKIEGCMKEIARAMVMSHLLAELVDTPLKWPDICDWYDDSRTDLDIRVGARGDEPLFSFEVQSSPEGSE